ncbi:MAG: CPBP family intramembrane metalloprotease [Chromatiales bacterium]|nr:CPBP family intramembrane metalloprotease [Chromatiales bacterium]
MNGAAASRRQTGWWLHLGLLGAYPVAIGLVGWQQARAAAGPALPASGGPLLFALGIEMMLFSAVFGTAWIASRASGDQLLLRWPGWRSAAWQGLAWSVALRLGLGSLVMAAAFLARLAGHDPLVVTDALQPDTEQLVDISALSADPVYLLVNMTVVSFVVAGLREELWRAGMLAALGVLFPNAWNSAAGRAAGVLLVALLFGLGHLAQGWGGVLLTTLLGAALGAIMVFHRSLWQAVFAHGFFNATSFLLLRMLPP